MQLFKTCFGTLKFINLHMGHITSQFKPFIYTSQKVCHTNLVTISCSPQHATFQAVVFQKPNNTRWRIWTMTLLHNFLHSSVTSLLTVSNILLSSLVLNKLWPKTIEKLPILGWCSWFLCTTITVTASAVVLSSRTFICTSIQPSVTAPVCIWTIFSTLTWW